MSKQSVFKKQLYERVVTVLRRSLKKWIRGVSSRREFRSVKVLFEVCYEDYERMEYWRVRIVIV
jgi:hypothetical protein